MRYLEELRKIIGLDPREPDDQSAADEISIAKIAEQAWVTATGTIMILDLIINAPNDNGETTFQNGQKAFIEFTTWAKMRYKRFHNKRIVEVIPEMMRKKYQLSPGALIKTTDYTSLMASLGNERTVVTVNPNIVFLYLGVETDPEFDTITLKMLSEKNILHYHKRESLHYFVENWGKKFQIVQKASIDKNKL